LSNTVNFEIEDEPPGAGLNSVHADKGILSIYPTNHHPNIQKLSLTLLRDTFVGTDHTGLSGSFSHLKRVGKNRLLVSEIPSTISPWVGTKTKHFANGGFRTWN
jgi:hypothetical protein